MTAVGAVGASARAAAMSLRRAGYEPWAADLFADRDLRRIAPTVRCPADRYPAALPGMADGMPPGPVLYTGGLENHPGVVRRLAERRELWGNPPAVLEQVRDPFRLSALLTAPGFAAPQVLPFGPPPPGRWLRKPLRSAGGHGIRIATPDDCPDPAYYLQEYVDGRPLSAVFVGGSLVGVTEQLVGEAWLHARPFAYCGSVGPVVPVVAGEIRDGGSRLAGAAGLRGVWGIDLLLADDAVYPVEVNPRYTASVEVVEHTTGRPVFGAGASGRVNPGRPVGKAIYFAPHRIVFPASGPWDADLTGDFDPWRLPAYADIPDPGEVVEPGWPVLTVFATGPTADACRAALRDRAAELDRLFP